MTKWGFIDHDGDFIEVSEEALRGRLTSTGEYQRFYDFVGRCDPAIVDAWHFTQHAQLARERERLTPHGLVVQST